MTGYECWMLAFTGIAAVATAVTAIAAIAAATIANGQLRSMAESIRVAGLLVIIDIEHKLRECKVCMDEAAAEFVRESEKERRNSPEFDKKRAFHLTKVEDYLNCLDRLCHCFLAEYVPSSDWRLEYREYLTEAVRTYPDHFRTGTPYTNIVRLNDRWSTT